MSRYGANDQIEQPYPKRGYLKLKMRSTYLIRFIPLQIGDDYTDRAVMPVRNPTKYRM